MEKFDYPIGGGVLSSPGILRLPNTVMGEILYYTRADIFVFRKSIGILYFSDRLLSKKFNNHEKYQYLYDYRRLVGHLNIF